jgi:hypothetical protein
VEISQCYRVVQQGKRRVKKQFSSFQDLLNNANLLILVDFYATWYRPCQMMVPVLEQVRVQLRDRLDYPPYTDKKSGLIEIIFSKNAMQNTLIFYLQTPNFRL